MLLEYGCAILNQSRAQSADSSKGCRKSNYVKLRIRLSEIA